MQQLGNVAELDVFITDLNGQARGKRVPVDQAEKLLSEGFKMPRSAVGLDIWGDDVVSNGLVFETGDNDGICRLVTDNTLPIPWLDGEHQQCLAMMTNSDGSAFAADPRQVLQDVMAAFARHQLTPVVATELEFYLLPESYFSGEGILPRQPLVEKPDAYSIQRLDAQRELLADIRRCCALQGIPADAVISELGHGQFEINLHHVADPVLAADQTILFKRLVKGVARRHQHRATFMAKPFGDRSGNGMHMHFSLLDKEGNNVFADGSEQGSDVLRHAVAGTLAAMPDSMLLFAPHLNSYRRLLPGTHAPVAANWGYENRTVAVRIPESPDVARRIEHRVAGADANPYLVVAVVLAAALYGIEQGLLPPEPLVGDSYTADDPGENLPVQWLEAIQVFENSVLIPRLLNDEMVRVLACAKQQEYLRLAGYISPVEYQTYW